MLNIDFHSADYKSFLSDIMFGDMCKQIDGKDYMVKSLYNISKKECSSLAQSKYMSRFFLNGLSTSISKYQDYMR